MRTPNRASAADRRSTFRVRRPLDGSCTGQSGRRPVRICDLSTTGCFVESLERAAPGERVTLQIAVPDWSVVEVTAEVVYSSAPMGYGVRFVDLSQTTELFLQAAVDALSRAEP